MRTLALPKRELVDVNVVHDRKQPCTQVAASSPESALVPRSRQGILHQIVGAVHIARQRPRIAAQARQRGNEVGIGQCIGHGEFVGRRLDSLRTDGRGSQNAHGDLDYVNLSASRIIGKLIACIDPIAVGYQTLMLDRDLMSQNQDVHLQRETRSKASGPPALLIPAGIRPLSL